jgi:hypothetical protein
MDGVLVVELIALASVRLAQLGPSLLFDEDGVPKAKGPFHEALMLVDIVSVYDNEHFAPPALVVSMQEFAKS